MKCACPWCPKEAEEGCEAFFTGEPTCKEHDYLTVFTDLQDGLNRTFGSKEGEESKHE